MVDDCNEAERSSGTQCQIMSIRCALSRLSRGREKLRLLMSTYRLLQLCRCQEPVIVVALP